jgi:alpha-amylase/alpha-mannosidase (GH57 family)
LVDILRGFPTEFIETFQLNDILLNSDYIADPKWKDIEKIKESKWIENITKESIIILKK